MSPRKGRHVVADKRIAALSQVAAGLQQFSELRKFGKFLWRRVHRTKARAAGAQRMQPPVKHCMLELERQRVIFGCEVAPKNLNAGNVAAREPTSPKKLSRVLLGSVLRCNLRASVSRNPGRARVPALTGGASVNRNNPVDTPPTALRPPHARHRARGKSARSDVTGFGAAGGEPN